ncbi:MAG TPA: hypothetical protein VNZ64_18765 [Candidatus Acidoferrum sp.]|jgi:hypothetical protein|nr:hypothetical protein [Candidatus Acidoferrum sp.]
MMVRIQNSDGQYLARDPKAWSFSEDYTKAMVLDFSDDQIAEQLRVIAKASGLALQAVPVDPREVHESCDRCGRVEAASEVFFDGRVFLCGRCRKRAPHRSARR